MNYVVVLLEIFLAVVAGQFGWLALVGYNSGQVSTPYGGARYRARNSDRRQYWVILGWYAGLALAAVYALAQLMGVL